MFIQMKSLKPAKSIKLLGGLAAGAALIVACGTDPAPLTAGGDAGSTAAQSGVASEAAINPIAASPVDATVGASALGDILVGPNGMSLYGFTNDSDGQSNCDGACADAWPPLLVDGVELPRGLDPQVFSIVTRSDGSFQLKAGKWPLYRFAGDGGPGEINGQGSGGVWFLAGPDGSLLKGESAAASMAGSDTDSSAEQGSDSDTDDAEDDRGY